MALITKELLEQIVSIVEEYGPDAINFIVDYVVEKGRCPSPEYVRRKIRDMTPFPDDPRE